MNILIVKTSAIGDVTHAMPAVNCLRKHYPGAHISWLVEEAASDLVLGHKAVDCVLIARRKQWQKAFKAGKWRSTIAEIIQFVKELRSRPYDLVIDFQGLLKSGIWVFLSRGKQRVGFGPGMQHSEGSYFFLNKRVKAVDMEIHALERQLLLLKAIDIPCPTICYDFPITTSQKQRVDTLLATNGYQKTRQKLVAINPQTKWDSKLWYNNRFAQVADGLASENIFLVFTGAPDDVEVIGEIQQMMQSNSLNCAGKTTLKELAALYSVADVVISTDTGPMHIAAAVGTPLVALFGPTAPWRTGPYGEKHHVLRSNVSCSPCFKRHCPLDNEPKKCMKQISVEEVVDATMAALQGR